MLIFVARIAGLLLLQSGRLNSMKRTITTQDACRPNAFTYCELPIITSLSEEPYPAFPGEELRIHCQAYGSPMPVIAWFRILANGESIDIPNTTGAHMINEAGTLRMKHVVPHDDGKYFCVASNSVGDSKALIEIKVSHPMVALIPLSVGNTFVTLTWNGSVHITADTNASPRPTHASVRHRHHVETRYRLSRHLLLKYRRYKEPLFAQPTITTTTIKLSPTARQHTIINLHQSTAYEFCIEFKPNDRPTTLLDCLILRTTSDSEHGESLGGVGYHQGHTILFLFLIIIVGGMSCICLSCYTYAIGRKLWKFRNKKGGFSSLGYQQDDELDELSNPAYPYVFYEDNSKRPLIARI